MKYDIKHRGYNNNSGYYLNCGMSQYKGTPEVSVTELPRPRYENKENVKSMLTVMNESLIKKNNKVLEKLDEPLEETVELGVADGIGASKKTINRIEISIEKKADPSQLGRMTFPIKAQQKMLAENSTL
jgi:hypothetical protein